MATIATIPGIIAQLIAVFIVTDQNVSYESGDLGCTPSLKNVISGVEFGTAVRPLVAAHTL